MTIRRPIALALLIGLIALLPACARSVEPGPAQSSGQPSGAPPGAPAGAAAANPSANPSADTSGSTSGSTSESAGGSARADRSRTAPEPSSTEVFDTWHAKTYVSGSMGLRLIYYWSKEDWMRAETVLGGHPIITIVRDRDYISFDQLSGRGVKIRRSPLAMEEDADRERPFGNDLEELIAQGAVLVEETEESGRGIEIWRITDTVGRRKLSLTRDEPRLPIRLESFYRAGAEMVTTDYSDWIRGLAIPDDFFEAPPRIQLEEFEYSEFIEASGIRAIGPILYPEFLHGMNPR